MAKSGLKDYKGAVEDYNKAIEFNCDNEYIYLSLGDMKTKLKDYIGAINNYNKFIELIPDSKEAYYKRGFAYFYSGDKDNACKDWEKANVLGHGLTKILLEYNCK